MAVKDKHPHYHKNVAHLNTIDVYRVLERFGVTDPTIQHAVKKLLVAGGRGAGKDQRQDVTEAIDSLNRYLEMYDENAQEGLNTVAVCYSDPIGEAMATADKNYRQAVAREIARSTPVNRKLSEGTKRDLARRKAAKRPARSRR